MKRAFESNLLPKKNKKPRRHGEVASRLETIKNHMGEEHHKTLELIQQKPECLDILSGNQHKKALWLDSKLLTQLETELFNALAEIKNCVKAKGVWCVPDEISDKYPLDGRWLPKATQVEENKPVQAFFNSATLFLHKFCYYKIKAICHYLKNNIQPITPKNTLILSIIDQQAINVVVYEAKLVFNTEGLVTSISPSTDNIKSEKNIIMALRHSTWLHNNNSQSIRITNQELSDSLMLRYCYGEVKYSLSNEDNTRIKPSKQTDKNFWLHLATHIKKIEAEDYDQIKQVENEIAQIKNTVEQPIELANPINLLTQEKQNGDQQKHIKNILRNNKMCMGSLLHLPPGYGKTFILLGAMAQHYRDCPEKKPYLVIVPKQNVRDAWEYNTSLLNNDDDETIFGETLRIEICDNTKKFSDLFADNPKQHIIIITDEIIKNYVGNILAPLPEFKGGTSTKVFQTALKKHHYTSLEKWLSLLVENSGLFSPYFYVVGEKSDWKNQLKSLINQSQNSPTNRSIRTQHTTTFTEHDIQTVISELSALQTYQSQQLEKYEHFKQQINGIILDESHEILSVSASGQRYENNDETDDSDESKKKPRTLKSTDVILDLSNSLQCKANINSNNNKLVIASSATPWPNAMNEFNLHLKFLCPKLIGTYTNLHKQLFKRWLQFETTIQRTCKEELSKPKEEQQLQEKIAATQPKINEIKEHFYRWKNIFLNTVVLYESPEANQINQTTESLLYVSCDVANSHNHDSPDSAKKNEDGNILSFIRNFYSDLLITSGDTTRKHQLPHPINSNLTEQIKALLPSQQNAATKMAFYIELTDDAAGFAVTLTNHYKEKYPDDDYFIGFYYNDGFVGKKGGMQKKVPETYTNITYNTDKDINKNAFNNIFRFDDFYTFCAHQFFYQKGHVFLDSEIAFRNNTALIFRFLSQIDEYINRNENINNEKFRLKFQPELEKIQAHKQKKLPAEYKKSMLDFCENIYNDLYKTGKVSGKWKQQFKFFIAIIKLEIKSARSIIQNFSDYINKHFRKYLPTSTDDSFKNHFRKMLGYIKTEKTYFTQDFGGFKNLIFTYLYKISRSTIFIFGQAGCSSMSIDANILFLISGAWTEGKLTQIKGRVGRFRSDNSTRACVIHLPLTNTCYEYKILQYYIKKFLYNSLIVSKESLNTSQLILPLILANIISEFFSQCLSSHNTGNQQLIQHSIHTKVKKMLQSEHNYLALEPLHKAITILPDEIAEVFSQCQNYFEHSNDHLNHLVENQPSFEPMDVENNDIIDSYSPPRLENTAVDLNNTSLSEASIELNNETKPSPPTIEHLANLERDNFIDSDGQTKLKKLALDKKPILLVMLPTRGKNPDHDLATFISDCDQLSQSCALSIVLLIGLNAESQYKKNIVDLINLDLTPYQIAIKLLPFLWYSNDIVDNKLPLGQMRNFCLQSIATIWQTILDHNQQKQNNIHFFSMDGDIKLSKLILDHYLTLSSDNINLVKFGTYGYDMQLSDATEELELTQIAMRLSNDINSMMQVSLHPGNEAATINYYSYPSEPLLFLTSTILTDLLRSIQKNRIDSITNPNKTAFGFWDCEGRFLRRYLTNVASKANAAKKAPIQMLGPPYDYRHRPQLINFERFKIGIDFLKNCHNIKEQLSKTELAELIKTIAGQPQNSIRPRTMGSNIAAALGIEATKVQKLSPHFYIKNFIVLLELGLKRSLQLARYLYQLNDNHHAESSPPDDLLISNQAHFNEFIHKNFKPNDANMDLKGEYPAIVYKLLTLWVVNASESLCHYFNGTYHGEIKSDGQFNPISLPDNYPKKAQDNVERENNELDQPQHNTTNQSSLIQAAHTITNHLSTNHHFLSIYNDQLKKSLDAHADYLIDIGLFQYGIFILVKFTESYNADICRNIINQFNLIYHGQTCHLIYFIHKNTNSLSMHYYKQALQQDWDLLSDESIKKFIEKCIHQMQAPQVIDLTQDNLSPPHLFSRENRASHLRQSHLTFEKNNTHQYH